MTDLEVTRLCAEAIGLPSIEARPDGVYCNTEAEWPGVVGERYDPLGDDAQAFRLMVMMRISAKPHKGGYIVEKDDHFVISGNVNIAICQLVARLQRKKQ